MGLISRSIIPGRRGLPGRLPAAELSLQGHPVASGLCFAFLGNGTGSHAFSRVDGTIGAFSGSSKPTWVAGQGLNIVYGGPTVSFLDWGASKCPQTRDLALGAFSVVARVFYRGSAGGLCERNDNNSVNAGWFIGMGNTANRCGLCIERASGNFAAYAAALPLNKWITLAICYPGNLTATGVKIYYDGVLQALVVNSDGSGAQGSDFANNFYLGRASFGNNSVGGNTFDGIINYLYIFRRFLRQDEVALLVSDPFIPFHDPPPITLPFTIPAPVLVSIQPATLQRGAVAYSIYLTGANTNWVNGVTAVTISGTGITVNSTTVHSPTYCSASLTVASNATLGPRTVTVTTGSEVVTI